MSLYWGFRGEWLDLTCGIPGVWALDPKLQFRYLKNEIKKRAGNAAQVGKHRREALGSVLCTGKGIKENCGW
jgi:hypothetical protein